MKRMPAVMRLREEQPGVVGVTATQWALEGSTLRCQRLVNGRVVSEETRELGADEMERLEAALGEAALATLPARSARPVGTNVGRIILEADGLRWETVHPKGAARTAVSAASPEARLQAVADAMRALSKPRR